MAKWEPIMGVQGGPVTVDIRHRCGHQLRWTFLIDDNATRATIQRRLYVGNRKTGQLGKATIAEGCPCPRCGGEAPVPGPCDVVFYPTGVAHAHDGPCPPAGDFADKWMQFLGLRLTA